jgi:hypothetical protein
MHTRRVPIVLGKRADNVRGRQEKLLKLTKTRIFGSGNTLLLRGGLKVSILCAAEPWLFSWPVK